MKKKNVKQKMVISALTGVVLILGNAIAVDAAGPSKGPVVGIEAALKASCQNGVIGNMNLYLVENEKGEFLNMAFSNVEDYIYIRELPDEDSEWTGKLYHDNAAEVLEYLDGWAKISSGNVKGYVPTDCLFIGKAAQEYDILHDAKTATVTADVLNVRDGQGTKADVLTQIVFGRQYDVTGEPKKGWYPLNVDGIHGWVSGEYITVAKKYEYAVSRKEEEERLKKEAEKAMAPKGQQVIDFACRFIGNPYVWGGTSLTDGADCSGYVQSVYANFGVYLPRTTWDMENVGIPVSYDEALPGDLVLYEGHVGLYMGDGNIVNALNSECGIMIINALYQPIKTIRRVL